MTDAQQVHAPAPPLSPARRELVRAALVCAAVVLLWLARALFALGTSVLAPSDVVQDFSLTRVDGAGPATNGALSDIAVQMLPWSEFAQREFAAGRVPLWNPHNGGGEPFLASYQSAVFSPFQLPFHVFDFPLALVVSAFLVLWLLAFAGYVFARELGASPLGAAAGAALLGFAAHNVLLLQYPHAAVAACAVLTLALAARHLNAAESDARARPAWQLARPGLAALFTAALAAEALAGHPEVLCFGAVLLAGFVLVRTLRIRGAERRRVARAAAELGVCALLAAGATAFQWLPFLEYLAHSAVVATRESELGALAAETWPQLGFPDLFGPPRALLPHAPILSFYEPTNAVYTGALALCAASAAIFLAWRRPFVRACACATFAWFCVAYDVAGLGQLVQQLPLLAHVPFNRGQLVAACGIALLAALAVTELETRAQAPRRGRAALACLVTGAAVLALLTWGAHAQASTVQQSSSAARGGLAWDAGHVAFVVATSVCGLAALAALVLTRARACGVLFVACLLAQNAWLFRAYLPLSDARTLFPRTPALAELERELGDGTLAILGDDVLPPELNLAYGIREIAAYDALWVREYDELYQRAFGRVNNWRGIRRASEADLEVFGVDLVLTSGTETPFTASYARARGPLVAPPLEVEPGRELAQVFVAGVPGLRAVTFVAVDPGFGATAPLTATLAYADGGAPIATRTWSTGEIAFNLRRRANLALEFAALADSETRPLRLAFTTEQQGDVHALAVQARAYADGETGAGDGERSLTHAGKRVAAELQLELRAEPSLYLPHGRIGTFDAFARRGDAFARRGDAPARRSGPARYRVLAADAGRAFETPLPRVELGAQAGALFPRFREPAGASVRVLTEVPGRVELAVRAPAGARLVTSLAAYPGWRARVDGEERALETWLGAFLALASDPADADREREVVLDYAPASFRSGVIVAAFALLLASGWFALSARSQRGGGVASPRP